jgi:hypothetical protein
MFMGQALRMPMKPLCISAQMLRARSVCHGGGPEFLLGKFFGHVFGNGQGVPNGQFAIDQHRHFANRVDVFQALLEF